MPSRINLNISWPYASVVLFLLILPAVVAPLYWWLSSTRKVEVIMAIVAAGIALTALVYSAITVNQILVTNEEKLDSDRKKYAAQIIDEYNDPTMPRLTTVAEALATELSKLKPGQVSEYLLKPENAGKEQQIILVLNFMEKLAFTVDFRLADEQLLKEYFQLIVRLYHRALKDYIEARQREFSSSDPGKKFGELAKRWG